MASSDSDRSSAYFLTQAALLLLYGQALTVFVRKHAFLFAIILFEIVRGTSAFPPRLNGYRALSSVPPHRMSMCSFWDEPSLDVGQLASS